MLRLKRRSSQGNAKYVEMKVESVGPGAQVRIAPGDRVPLDGKIVEGTTTLDQSMVTGESMPAEKGPGATVWAGTVNLTSTIEVTVTAAASQSLTARIIEAVENAQSSKSPVQRFVDKFAAVYTPIVFVVALCVAIVPPLFLGDWLGGLYKALCLLVIACPCALVISIPLSFFAGIGGASHEGILIKGSNYLEALSDAKYLVFDKTGTLTQGVFEVTGVHHSTLEEAELLEYAALAECASSHPISKSLQKAYGKEIDRSRVSDIEEISGHGITAVVDGHTVAAGNAKLMKKLGIEAVECHSVGTIIHMVIDGQYAGHIVISDVPKPHAKEAIAALKKCGVKKTVMLTGDTKRVAEQVAAELGVDEVRSELLPGDKVTVEVSVYDLTQGRIIFRSK